MAKREYNILSEVESIMLQAGKPDWWSSDDWNELPLEAKSLWCRCEELGDLLPEQFHKAVRKEEWRQALFLYMTHNRKPWLPLRQLNLDTMERNWEDSEPAEFIAKAKKWIAEAEGLLSSEY